MPDVLQPSDSPRLQPSLGLSLETRMSIDMARDQLSQAVRDHTAYFVSVDGPCPLTNNADITLKEAQQKAQNADGLDGYIGLDRECFYKPRTNPEDWHGIDTSDRVAAHGILSELAARHANLAAEIGDRGQLVRYNMLTMVWLGGRSIDNLTLVEEVALTDPDVVVAVKNGLDGEIEPALRNVAMIERLREGQGAPAILVYRGGTNAQTPEASQEAYKRAHEATDGRLFYDAAHGVEMAYDPSGGFQKSSAGQVLASQALVHMAREGYPPLGKFAEASAIEAVMDPHMPLDLALSDSRQIHAAKLG